MAAIAVLAPLMLILGLSIYFFSRAKQNSSNNLVASQPINSVAIMPFSFASSDPKVLADPDKEYLSDGITESLINNLSHLPDLKVIASASVFRYKGQQTDPQKVAQELGVQAIVTGRIMQREDTLTIRVALVDAQDGRHIWGEQYERKLSELVAAQSDLAKQIAEHLRPALSPDRGNELAKRPTENSEAYQLYLKGRYYWNKRNKSGYHKAIEFFQQAIDRDPNYALAYTGLADSYGMLGDDNLLSPQEAYPKARTAALRALELDNSLSEAHTSLAGIKTDYDWDWEGAEQAYKRAIELNPNYATAHQWYGLYLDVLGRPQEALAQIKIAREIDPFSLSINANVAYLLYTGRQYDSAIEECRRLLEMDPNFVKTHFVLTMSYESKGMYAEAIEAWQKLRILQGNNSDQVATRAAELQAAYASAGARGFWQKKLDWTLDQSPGAYRSPVVIAQLYARLENKDQAFEWLEKAYQVRHSRLTRLKSDPAFDNLRADPRFTDLLRRMKFPGA